MMKAPWIMLIVLGGVAAIGAAAFFVFGGKGPDLGSYLPLKEPRIARMGDERVLEVKFSGPGMKPPKARYALPDANDPAAAEKLAGFLAHEMGFIEAKDYWTIIRYRVEKAR
jgi:hypothetical protein